MNEIQQLINNKPVFETFGIQAFFGFVLSSLVRIETGHPTTTK